MHPESVVVWKRLQASNVLFPGTLCFQSKNKLKIDLENYLIKFPIIIKFPHSSFIIFQFHFN